MSLTVFSVLTRLFGEVELATKVQVTTNVMDTIVTGNTATDRGGGITNQDTGVVNVTRAASVPRDSISSA